MFENIGRKIKTVALITTWIGIIVSVIVGLLLIGNDLAIAGIITMAVGSLASWLGSFMTYGFGQLVENTDILVKPHQKTIIHKNENTEKNSPPIDKSTPVSPIKSEYGYFICPSCRCMSSKITNQCSTCGQKFISE